MSSRKKDRQAPDTVAPAVQDENSVCSEEDSSCPKSCLLEEDEENTSC
ncbi:hypothetical protein [Pelotomaculum propionicicum]|uniref:Uncharacterized protein n=1 Tax=Pelotomaculum propionicicum TaxID=258475 RepID=A0A4Y7RIW9_9FIRM|nr:hypothetical protein [Pelotomaculum propionicicum]NLI12984.1 hypothetical protein [Peptococcaceae bacterium]TEB08935.1 hypothetical protein Pmgp_03511 [Pelotomaculum propionicicum]